MRTATEREHGEGYVTVSPTISPTLCSADVPVRRNPGLARAAKRAQPYCLRCSSTRGLCAHHVVPLCEGGADDIRNLSVICGACHKEWHGVVEGVLSYDDFLDTAPLSFILRVWNEHTFEAMPIGAAREAWARHAFQAAVVATEAWQAKKKPRCQLGQRGLISCGLSRRSGLNG